jgi:predicted metal-dependent hydrolase
MKPGHNSNFIKKHKIMKPSSPEVESPDSTVAAQPAAPALHMPSATGLTVRKLDIDLGQGFARHWHGGDAFLSQYFNALSMSFPLGEQSFIDAVRDCAKLLPHTPANALLHDTVAQFMAQEATHRRIHAQYNVHLMKQGLVNHWERRIAARLEFAYKRGIKPLHFLAVTAAYEHLTAVLSDYVLRHDEVLAGADPQMQTLWRWHAAEETEHCAVAFDLYKAIGGNYLWRIRWFAYALLLFVLDAGWQTANNLWHDGTFFKPGTWWSAAKFFWGKKGAIWLCTGPLLAYFRPAFHPGHESESNPALQARALAQGWLKNNAKSFRVVR